MRTLKTHNIIMKKPFDTHYPVVYVSRYERFRVSMASPANRRWFRSSIRIAFPQVRRVEISSGLSAKDLDLVSIRIRAATTTGDTLGRAALRQPTNDARTRP